MWTTRTRIARRIVGRGNSCRSLFSHDRWANSFILAGDSGDEGTGYGGNAIQRLAADRPALTVLSATAQELEAHQQFLARIKEASGIELAWDD